MSLSSSYSWQKQLAGCIKDPFELFKLLEIDPSYLSQKRMSSFPLRVPVSFVNRMKKGDRQDPLLRQVLPLDDECVSIPGFSQDPLQEKKFNILPGLIHKYKNRILLTLTGACAVHCRYCFRQHFPYEENNAHQHFQTEIIAYLNQHPEIHEVIFSGGDPLIAPDKVLSSWIFELEKIPHIENIRIHSRLPVVLPDRITDGLIDVFISSRLPIVLVIHCNHPQEIDETVGHVLLKLRQAGILVLNQAVLLKKVNDKLETLVELNKKLFQFHVLPYYLHVLDKVQGAHHFEVSEIQGKRLWQGLLAALPGYLVPRLVKEEPRAQSKTWLISDV